MNAQAAAGIGHNQPPEEHTLMIDKLARDYSDDITLYENRLAREAELPSVVATDADAAKYADYIKQITSSSKALDAARKTEKEPHLEKGRIVDSFFKSKIEKIEVIKKRVEEPLARFLKEKEDRKRREAEEKARQEKAEADRKLREAQEAEAEERRKREEAERETKRIADEAAAATKKAEEEAERVRKETEAAAEAKRQEAAKIQKEKDDRIAQLEKENKDLELKAEEDKKAAEKRDRELEAEKSRISKEADAASKRSEKEAKEIEKSGEKEAKQIETDGRMAQREADQEVREIEKEVRQAEKESDEKLDAAVRQDRIANRAGRAADTKGSLLSRTRGEMSLASVTEKWVGVPRSREELFQSAAIIWEHIPFSAFEQAVQSAVNAGERNIPGADIYQDTKTQVR